MGQAGETRQAKVARPERFTTSYGKLLACPYLHYVCQPADPRDLDVDDVARMERKVIGRHDAGAGEEKGAVREGIVARQPAYQVFQVAGHGGKGCGAGEGHRAAALDFQPNRHAFEWRHGVSERDDRPERAATVVDLGLGQIEWIFAFDVAGTHVI